MNNPDIPDQSHPKSKRPNFAAFIEEKRVFDAIVAHEGGRWTLPTRAKAVSKNQQLNTFRKKWREHEADLAQRVAVTPQAYDYFIIRVEPSKVNETKDPQQPHDVVFIPKAADIQLAAPDGTAINVSDRQPEPANSPIADEEPDPDGLLDAAKSLALTLGAGND